MNNIKLYARATLESVTLFYIATFCLAVFFKLHGLQSPLQSILMVVTYAFIIGLLIHRIVRKFTIAALMLIVPIAPLLALIIIVTMLPLIEKI